MPGDVTENAASGSSGPSQQRDTASQDESNNRYSPMEELPSTDQVVLLGAIDSLRQEHLGGDIDIPQIVVCGDQSCGKSSVLEAISGVTFPTGAKTTTRFATEVILRKSDKEARTVRIIASSDRSAEDRKRIKDFESSLATSGPQDFKRLIEEAEQHLRGINPGTHFWKDWLRVEISGPDQPHLTLVDLPGIIHHESEGNAAPGDANNIRELVRCYVKNPRTTVLAVVNALNNIETQEIIGLTSELAGDRTLGILTKIDRLEDGSQSKDIAVSLARDRRIFSLGWHVLANQRHDLPGRSPNKRDAEEHDLLSRDPWSQLDPKNLGIQALRKKLSEHLFRTITLDLERLVKVMARQRDQLVSKISLLGQARPDISQQRQYLGKVLEKLSRLIEDGLEENFDRKESREFFGASTNRRLRLAVRNQTDAFADRMRNEGRQYQIFLSGGERDFVFRNNALHDLPRDEEPNFAFPYTSQSSEDREGNFIQYNVPLKRYCSTLSKHINLTRGKDLRGTSTTKNIRDTFRQFSAPWDILAKQFAQRCFSTVVTFLKDACRQAGGEHTGAALQQHYVLGHGSRFQNRREKLNLKMEELLWPFTECHPMTCRLDFNAASAFQTYTNESRSDKTWGDLARESSGYTAGMIEAADVLVQTESYYKIALDTFVDNATSLGVEMCLLRNLSRLVEPSEVHSMDDELITELAAERPEVAAEREQAERQVAVLDKVISTCTGYLPDPESSPQTEHVTSRTPQSGSTMRGPRPKPDSGIDVNRTRTPDGSQGNSNVVSGFGGNVNPTTTVTPASSTSGGLFGSKRNSSTPASSQDGAAAASGSLFASSTSAAQPATSTGGLSGFKPSSSQPTTSTGSPFGKLGGQSSGKSASAGGGLFGQPAPQPGPFTNFSFGNTSNNQGGFGGTTTGSSLFRQMTPSPQPAQTTTSLFARPNNEEPPPTTRSKSPFVAVAEGTGRNSSPARGTVGMGYLPVEDRPKNCPFRRTDFLHSITALPDFKKTSFEELRLEDYNAGRNRPAIDVFATEMRLNTMSTGTKEFSSRTSRNATG